MNSQKQRPSDTDPIETRASILKAIAAAESPVSPASLRSIAQVGRSAQIQTLLAEDLTSGTVFQWGASNKPTYWHRDPEVVARERILDLTSIELLTRVALKKRVAKGTPPLSTKVVEKVQKELIRDKLLREVPAAARSKTKRLLNAKRPEIYLEEAVASLLEAFGLPRPIEQIRALLAVETPRPSGGTASAEEVELVRDTAEKIFAAMNRIAFSPGTTVTFYKLRQQPELVGISKALFDQAALQLQREHRALLSIHGHALALPDEERDNLVTDGFGKFYVSIYAR
jgi:hypothetical protein